MEGIEKIKSKIEKLYAKAESATDIGSIEEAQAFMAKVQEMLTEYNLELSDLNKGKPEVNGCIRELIDLAELHGWSKTDGDWLIYLYNTLARFNFCKIIIYGVNGPKIHKIYMIGEPHNIEMIKYIASNVVPKIKKLRLQRYKEYSGPDKPNAFKRSYYRGVAHGIKAKLQEQRDLDKQKHAGYQGLMVLSEKLVDEKIAEEFSRLKSKKASTLSASSAQARGLVDGKNININQGLNNGGNQISK